MSRRKLIPLGACCTLVAALSLPAPAATPQQLPKLAARSARHDAYGLDAARVAGVYDLSPPALRAQTPYAAALFPLALRLTPPDGTWLGGHG